MPFGLLVLLAPGCDTSGTGASYPAADLVRFDLGARDPGVYDPREGEVVVEEPTEAGHDWALAFGVEGVYVGVPALGEVRRYALDGTDEAGGTVVATGAASERYGAAVAVLGHTLWVGVPDAKNGPEKAGAGAVARVTTTETRLRGAVAQGHLGETVAACGDLFADGAPDVVATAPWEADLGGRAYLLADGEADGDAAPDGAEEGEANAGFGQAIACKGDLLGDAAPDLVIGAPFADDALVDRSEGRVTVWSGEAWTAGSPALTLSVPASGDTQEGAAFGASVASCHLRDDSRGDLLVGAPGAFAGDGAAYLFIGRDDLASATTATLVLRGSSTAGRFGATVACADLDGDGFDELLVGAPGVDAPDGSREIGALYAFSGLGRATGTLSADGATWALAADRAFLRTGRTFLAADLEGTGRAELVLVLRARARATGTP